MVFSLKHVAVPHWLPALQLFKPFHGARILVKHNWNVSFTRMPSHNIILLYIIDITDNVLKNIRSKIAYNVYFNMVRGTKWPCTWQCTDLDVKLANFYGSWLLTRVQRSWFQWCHVVGLTVDLWTDMGGSDNMHYKNYFSTECELNCIHMLVDLLNIFSIVFTRFYIQSYQNTCFVFVTLIFLIKT